MIINNYVKIVIVLDTRESKSFVFILILRLLFAAITIIVISIVALIANLIRCYIKYDIAYIEWEKKLDLNIYILNGFNLLFVSIESASI